MPDNKENDMQIPKSLSLRDLITIASMCISLTIAWGVLGTRLTVLEKEVVQLKEADARIASDVDATRKQVRKLEIKTQDDQQFIDDLYRHSNRSVPRRTNDN